MSKRLHIFAYANAATSAEPTTRNGSIAAVVLRYVKRTKILGMLFSIVIFIGLVLNVFNTILGGNDDWSR